MNGQQIILWAMIGFLLIGAGIGMLGVWVEDFWSGRHAWGPKLLGTDAILAATAIAVALVMKWLG